MIKKATTQEEIEQTHALASYAFNIEHTEEQKQDYIKKNQQTINYVMTNELDEISSQIICYPFEVTILGQVMKMAGIGDVGTYPETRGNGSIRSLFQSIFNDLHENGTALSYLAPFSQIFYRKFGYENLFNNQEIRIPKATIKQIIPELTGKVARVKWEETTTQTTLKNLYQKTLGQENGTLIRPDFWWEYVLKPSNQIKIAICYDDHNKPTGYLLYHLVSYREFVIKELAYENTTAMKQLLTFISSHSGSFDEFISHNVRDEMLLTQFKETQGIVRKTHSGMMGRIVNLKTFIESYPFNQRKEEACFYLEVFDEMCEWNHGVFKVIIKDGQGTCEKQENTRPIDYSGTIQQWLPVLMGVHSLDQSVIYELIEKHSADDALSDLIQTVTPHLYDYF